MKRRELVLALLVALLAAPCSRLLGDGAPGAEATKAYQSALAKLQAGDGVAAETGFLRAAELAPDWGAPNAQLGVLYQGQGKEAEAREQYALVQIASFAAGKYPEGDAATVLRKALIENEAYLIYLVNAARLQNGQRALVPDPTVGLVARAHSEEMRDKNYFDHESPTPGLTNCQDRFRAVFGYKPRMIGENVARRWGSMYCLRPEKILQSHTDLMNSPGHRRNVLYPTFEWLGLGLAANANGDYWITEVFVESGR